MQSLNTISDITKTIDRIIDSSKFSDQMQGFAKQAELANSMVQNLSSGFSGTSKLAAQLAKFDVSSNALKIKFPSQELMKQVGKIVDNQSRVSEAILKTNFSKVLASNNKVGAVQFAELNKTSKLAKGALAASVANSAVSYSNFFSQSTFAGEIQKTSSILASIVPAAFATQLKAQNVIFSGLNSDLEKSIATAFRSAVEISDCFTSLNQTLGLLASETVIDNEHFRNQTWMKVSQKKKVEEEVLPLFDRLIKNTDELLDDIDGVELESALDELNKNGQTIALEALTLVVILSIEIATNSPLFQLLKNNIELLLIINATYNHYVPDIGMVGDFASASTILAAILNHRRQPPSDK